MASQSFDSADSKWKIRQSLLRVRSVWAASSSEAASSLSKPASTMNFAPCVSTGPSESSLQLAYTRGNQTNLYSLSLSLCGFSVLAPSGSVPGAGPLNFHLPDMRLQARSLHQPCLQSLRLL